VSAFHCTIEKKSLNTHVPINTQIPSRLDTAMEEGRVVVCPGVAYKCIFYIRISGKSCYIFLPPPTDRNNNDYCYYYFYCHYYHNTLFLVVLTIIITVSPLYSSCLDNICIFNNDVIFILLYDKLELRIYILKTYNNTL